MFTFSDCRIDLPIVLSKAPPSLELSAILIDLLQVPRTYLVYQFPDLRKGSTQIEPQRFFMAICLYLYVSNYTIALVNMS